MSAQLFRAWHKQHGMIYHAEHFSLDDALTGNLTFFGGPAHAYGLADFVFMQWTGIHDKHQKAVYEEDIIECRYRWYGRSMLERRVVRYGANRLLLPFHQPFANGKLWIEGLEQRFEIIGNSYEHPELLQKVGQYG